MMTDIETKFNLADSIPAIGVGSGCIRAVGGVGQAVFGSFAATGGLCGEMIKPGDRQCVDLRKFGQEHALHGTLNVMRGAVGAFFSCLALGAVVQPDQNIAASIGVASLSLVPFAFQMISKNGFAPRIQYDYPSVAEAQPVSAKEQKNELSLP